MYKIIFIANLILMTIIKFYFFAIIPIFMILALLYFIIPHLIKNFLSFYLKLASNLNLIFPEVTLAA